MSAQIIPYTGKWRNWNMTPAMVHEVNEHGDVQTAIRKSLNRRVSVGELIDKLQGKA